MVEEFLDKLKKPINVILCFLNAPDVKKACWCIFVFVAFLVFIFNCSTILSINAFYWCTSVIILAAIFKQPVEELINRVKRIDAPFISAKFCEIHIEENSKNHIEKAFESKNYDFITAYLYSFSPMIWPLIKAIHLRPSPCEKLASELASDFFSEIKGGLLSQRSPSESAVREMMLARHIKALLIILSDLDVAKTNEQHEFVLTDKGKALLENFEKKEFSCGMWKTLFAELCA